MKKSYVLLFFVLIIAKSYSQSYTYGKEWITYSQKYYKVKLFKDGIYRIDSATLASAGVPLGSINPKNFQVFIKGQEQFIHVHGESDGTFDATDFIEFYGMRNDCSFDSSMYVGASVLPNPYRSVLQDTAIAFLTWSNSSFGKRYFIETDTSFSSYTPARHFFNHALAAYEDGYVEGKHNTVDAEDNRYDPTESRAFLNGVWAPGTGIFTVSTPYADSAGPAARLVTNVLGESVDYSLSSSPNLDHHITLEWKDASGTNHLFADRIFFGYKNFRDTLSIPSSQLGPLTGITLTSIYEPSYVNSNYTTPSFISMWYPQLYNLNGRGTYHLYIPDESAQSKTFADFSNFSHGTDSVKAFDLTNGKIVYPVMNGNSGKFILPNASGIKNVYLASSDSDIVVASLEKVNGTGMFADYSLQNADSAFLIVTSKKFITEANAYAAFRHSPAGGGYNTIVADIEDLYDQFAYGIAKHPKSIRNFCKFLADSSQYTPKYLFLIGKSTYGYYGLTDQNYYSKNLVPSYGFPPSDNMITAGLNGTYLEPLIPTGRLSVTEPAEVTDYLGKVMQHDMAPLDIWQKNVMHFIGGFDQIQQTTFTGFMNTYKKIIEDTSFGANVTSYSKNTSSPIQALVPGDIINKVDSGVSLMTFYGHSSNGAFDININDPNVFNNTGKYPVFLANSCYAGDIHRTDTTSLSEQYVFAKDKGAVCFLASVSIGVAEYLRVFSEFFYKSAAYYEYGKGVGDMVKGAIVSTENYVQSVDSIERLTCMDMTLHGDPSVRINLFTKPDYSIKNSDLTFDMTVNTTVHIDSFKVSLNISNLARAVNKNLKVRIHRQFPGTGGVADYLTTIPAPHYKATVDFYIPIDLQKGIGLNTFDAWIDQQDSIDEIDNVVNNHISGIPLVVNGSDIVPVYPYEYEIVPTSSTVRLKASTANVFEPARNYIFQIDTTDLFNSPVKLSAVINSVGGTVEWNVTLPNLNLPNGQDSVVYFWRVSRDSLPGPGNGYNWRESSFQMIAGKYGWGQSHFFQFKKDKFRFVDYNRPARHFDFVKSVNSIHVLDGFYSFWPYEGNIISENLNFHYNSILEHAASYADNGWQFVIIDSTSGELQINKDDLNGPLWSAQYGTCNYNPGSDLPVYDFGVWSICGSYTGWRDSMMMKFLHDIPHGKYLLGYSNNYWRGDFSTGTFIKDSAYSQALYDTLEMFGLPSTIETMPDTQAIVFMGRRGLGAGNAHYVISPNRATNITFEDSVAAHWKNGYITSPIIGPAKKWNSLHWNYREFETANSYDSVYIKVYGVTASGQEDSLTSYGEAQLDVLNLSGVLPALNNYPFLRLVAVIKDDSLHTAPQMKKWQVLYDPIPEGAINPLSGFAILNPHDTVEAGDLLRVNIPFKNISEFSFKDTLVFTYWVEDAAHVTHPLTPDRLKLQALAPDSVFIDSLALDVINYPGLNALWVEVNPVQNSKYQPEQYQFNNVARIPFGVSTDKINPILDVTFDGLHILNADIVSARPKILITVKDENHFLALNDTADFDVYLTSPGSLTEKRVSFCFGCTNGIWDSINPDMSFTAAVLPNNSCKIEFNPVLVSDGLYTLHVKAKDRSNNQSGANDYRIQFEIVNKPTITHIMNYPNPFSTNTKFVFTLTGYEVPETFMIQVMTITGKVVREIKREELGFIHIGRNITEYSWDGKDDFGDPLANGTYLYRVTTRLNGNTIENRETGADKFFTKEIGKMVLIR